MQPELLKQGFLLGLHRTLSLMKKVDAVAIRLKKIHYLPMHGNHAKKQKTSWPAVWACFQIIPGSIGYYAEHEPL